MKRIGLLSDTHTYLVPQWKEIFNECDEIWHAGDIGNMEVLELLRAFRPLRAVHGNIDDHNIRKECPEIQLFELEEVKVLMVHIGGYPGKYQSKIRKLIDTSKPKLFISGHSHILKVMNDKERGLLHMNPGAAGKSGYHKLITMLRFTLDKGMIKDLEVIELPRKGKRAY